MVKLLGVETFFTNINILTRIKMPNLYRSFMEEIMIMVLRDSLARTPVDTGFLRASARKVVKYSGENGAFGEISYNAPYSVPVHEVLTSVHPIGESKFLENAIRFITPLLPKMLKRRINTAFSRRAMRDSRMVRMADGSN